MANTETSDSRFRRYVRIARARTIDIATIVAGFVVLLYQLVFGWTEEQLPLLISIQVALLALLVVSQFVAYVQSSTTIRKSENKIADGISEMQAIAMSLNESRLLLRPPLSNEMFSGANGIWLMGISLHRTLTNHWNVIQRRLENGAKVTVVLVDWRDEDIKREYISRYLMSTDASAREQRFAARFNIVEELLDQLRGITDGDLRVVYSKFFPACGITLVNAEDVSCNGFYELYLNRMDGDQPHFKLNARSGTILEMLIKEFETFTNDQSGSQLKPDVTAHVEEQHEA